MAFSDFYSLPLQFLLSPSKRLFFGYLIGSFVLAVVVLFFSGNEPRSILHKIFDRRIWFHPSAKLDYKLFLFNSWMRIVFLAVTSVSSVYVALFLVRNLNRWWPSFSRFSLSYEAGLLLFTLASFVAIDFSRFFQHYLMHKVPFLWRIHRLHHTAEVLTPMTLYRTHPLESLLGVLRRTLVVGVLAAGFIFLTRSSIGAYEIIGVNIIDFVFNLLGSNLRHSHIWLSFGPLNHIFISPAQHQIHHSRDERHFDKNFGVALSLWDKLFGSFFNVGRKPFLVFGVRERRDGSVRNKKNQGLREAILDPFR